MIGRSAEPRLVERPRGSAPMPSIMSDGATMSAPARACTRPPPPAAPASDHCRPPRRQQAAVTVVGILAEANVGDEEQTGRRPPDGLEGALHDAVGSVRLRADGVLHSGRPNSRTAGTPTSASRRHSSAARSTDSWATPGMLGPARSHAAAGRHEQRLDELRGRHVGLAHQPAEALRSAAAASGGRRGSDSSPFWPYVIARGFAKMLTNAVARAGAV